MMRMIIDTDAGVDDAQAIMMALTHPGVTVEAITTLTGNIHVDKVVPNVFMILDVMKCDIPVYRGADLPLVSDWFPEDSVHGTDGLGEMKNRPPTSRRLETEHAALALIRLADANPGQYTLVALGPMTNVALAVKLDPTFPSKIKQFVWMGGTIAARGNTPNIAAEWNIFCDPEAAYMVLEAFPESTMLSWETTREHPFTWEKYDALTTYQTEAGRFFHDSSTFMANVMRKSPTTLGFLLPDPLAMAITLDPSIIQTSIHRYVTVELGGRHTRGQTVIDHSGRLKKAANVHVVTHLDVDRVYQMFQRMLA